MICLACNNDVNPYMEMQANGSFARRCPRSECYAVLPPETSEEPGTLADVFSKEDGQPEVAIGSGESPGIGNVVALPSNSIEIEGLIQQMTTRKEWLLKRIDELQGCVRELELVDRMLAAAKESEEHE